MTRISIFVFFCLLAGTAFSQQPAGKFKFAEETHDFGEIAEGQYAVWDFQFDNVGDAPIAITEVHGSCGCIVTKWPLMPIPPGGHEKIHMAYTTRGHPGIIRREVYVSSNAAQKTVVLHITGFVKPPAAADSTQKK